MTGRSLKYLCAIMNSSIITWLMDHQALKTGMGLIQWKKFTVESLPIPKLSDMDQRPFIRLVESILAKKASDLSADTSEQEGEIDRLVYELYRLTADEIGAVEESAR